MNSLNSPSWLESFWNEIVADACTELLRRPTKKDEGIFPFCILPRLSSKWQHSKKAGKKAYLGITFMWMILIIYFKVCHPVYPKGFQQYIAYLIRVCDFEKVELSYLHSLYHIRGSISQGNPTIYRKLRAFHFLHGLYLYF